MSRILQGTVFVAFAFALAACNPAPQKNEDSSPPPEKGAPAGAPVAPKTIDLGDVEASLRLEAKVGAASSGPSVKVDETLDFRQKLVMTTVDVAPPAPKEFRVTLTLTSSSAFNEAPVAVRAKVFRDEAEVGYFAVALGADAMKRPFEHSVDVLAGLSSAPNTMLVHAEAEVILLPAGTDPATVDLKATKGTPDTTGSLLSNPMRINFGGVG